MPFEPSYPWKVCRVFFWAMAVIVAGAMVASFVLAVPIETALD